MFKSFIKMLARSVLKTLLAEAAPFIKQAITEFLKGLYKQAKEKTPHEEADDKVVLFIAELVGLKKEDLEA